jgi:hypothetical protein
VVSIKLKDVQGAFDQNGSRQAPRYLYARDRPAVVTNERGGILDSEDDIHVAGPCSSECQCPVVNHT